jgi:phosphatidylethanolamine-binding protein (PEBP) family uncharacterized protein
MVARQPIAKSAYEHWRAVEQALGTIAGAGRRALGYLITTAWLQGEARARGVSVSNQAVEQRIANLERRSFPRRGTLKAFLARSHESQADLRARARNELLESYIAAEVAPGGGSRRTALLESFQRAFQRRWRSRTTCLAAYVMEDCSEYRSKPPNRGGEGSAAQSAGSSRRSAGGSQSSGSSAGVDGRPGIGGMTLSSSAFEPNGAISARYTCDGADVSPALRWENVPHGAAALVLFVIDDTSSGSAEGIRWVVGDIDPHSEGVATGATPQGGIVGTDTQGHAGYGGICPAHGKTSTIEFVLWALRRKIPLTAGFAPTVAEREYSESKDLLGPAAITYATYHRR